MQADAWHLRSGAAFWRSPLGARTLRWEQGVLDNFADRVFGYHALGVGLTCDGAAGLDIWAHCTVGQTFSHVLSGSYTASPPTQSACFNLADWPIQNDALDYIVLPHVLEFVADPHAVLREAARCIRPGGSISIVGFNPKSVLALQSRRLGLGSPARWISRRRLVDWLALLDLHSDKGALGQWRPSVAKPETLARLAWLDTAGERWWPQMANVYAMRVVKRVSPDLRQVIRPAAARIRVPGLRPAVKTTQDMPKQSNTET